MDLALVAGAAAMSAPVAAGVDWLVQLRAAMAPSTVAGIEQLDLAGSPGSAVAGGTGRARALRGRSLVVTLSAAAAAAWLAARDAPPSVLAAELVLVAALVPLAACDYEWLLLPKRTVWWTTAATAVAVASGGAATGQWHRVAIAAAGGLALAASLGVLSLVNPRWMGFGDVRLALPFGTVLAWAGGVRELVLGFFVANALAGVVSAVLLASRRIRPSSALPFGVFLAVGGFATLALVHPVGA